MRKSFLYYLLALVLVASCRKDDDHVFDKSPDQRVAEALANYQSIIAGATDGWTAHLITGDSSYFSFYFRFNNDNRVVMMSDFSLETATTPMESSYRLKALQQPALIFDTYGYIHILADPDAGVNGGEYGRGRVSDFEYAIDTATAETVELTGRFNGTKLTLKKATAQERAIWEGGQIADAINSLNDLGKILEYFKRLNLGGVEYEVLLDAFSKKATFTWIDGGNPQTVTRGYYVVPGGVQLSDPVVNGGTSIPGFNIVSFNNGTLTMNVSVNGVNGTIKGANRPINPDKTAFTRFRNKALNGDAYWITVDGFHKDGVDDAFNVKSLATDTSVYYYYLYWPEYLANLDLYAPVYLNVAKNGLELVHGLGLRSSVLTDGRARLRENGLLGDFPFTGPVYESSLEVVANENFWFVQTSANSFDMVNAVDARSWVNWYWIFE